MTTLGLHPANTELMDRRTRDMMLGRSPWPNPDNLPLKCRGDGPFICGEIARPVAGEDAPVVIHVYGGPITYSNIDAALRDGWTVD
jgi:hypothetical protein